MSLAQPPTVNNQQPCAVVSLASTRLKLVWSDQTAPQLCLLQLLLPNCIHFGCCSPITSASTCCSFCSLQLLLPNCVHFSCCFLTASSSAAAPRVCQLVITQSYTQYKVQNSRLITLVLPPKPRTSTSVTHTHTTDALLRGGEVISELIICHFKYVVVN